MRKQTKRILAIAAMVGLVLVLAGCSNAPVTSHSTGFWDRYIVYNAAEFVLWLAKVFGGNSGVGIIVFTLIIRILIFPLSYISTKNMTKQSEIAPQMKELQKKYSGKDPATQEKLRDETQKLYAEAGVNPVMGCLPMLVQMPFLFALYQAIFRTEALKVGHFLWMSLGSPDPLYIMAILAAVFTGLTSWVSMLAQPVQTSMNWIMVAVMPIFIFIMALSLPSAVSIYWVVTNAFSLLQTFIIQNPFKLAREREAKANAAKEHDRALRRARKRALGHK